MEPTGLRRAGPRLRSLAGTSPRAAARVTPESRPTEWSGMGEMMLQSILIRGWTVLLLLGSTDLAERTCSRAVY